MSQAGLSALAGYAIGTAQILVLDWLRARWAHARQLRLLRAELRRVAEFQAKFNLRIDVPPASDELPRPATVSSRFVDTVAAVDFWITDEHRDDNSQQALLGVADGFVALLDIHSKAVRHLEALRSSDDINTRREQMELVASYAAEYDEKVDYTQYVVKDSLRDIERRLKLVRFWPQLRRVLIRLPEGSNPAPLKKDDPRLRVTAEPGQTPRPR